MVTHSLYRSFDRIKLNEEKNTYQRDALLVENSVVSQKIMRFYLSSLGYQVEVVNNASVAIEIIKIKSFDLMIIDIGLSEASGIDVIRSVRQCNLNLTTPLLVWSSLVNNDEEKYLNLGADAILDKTCSAKVLEKTIQECHLITGYERKFNLKLNRLSNKFLDLIDIDSEVEDKDFIDHIHRFRSFFYEILSIIEEHMSDFSN